MNVKWNEANLVSGAGDGDGDEDGDGLLELTKLGLEVNDGIGAGEGVVLADETVASFNDGEVVLEADNVGLTAVGTGVNEDIDPAGGKGQLSPHPGQSAVGVI